MSCHTRAFNCPDCSASFPSRLCARGHNRREHGIPCDVTDCSRKLIGTDGLAQHKEAKHTDNPENIKTLCEQCNRTLTGQKGLEQHQQQKHSDEIQKERSTKCKDCKAKFFDNLGLNQHIKHTHPAVLPRESFLNLAGRNLNSYIKDNLQPNEPFNTNRRRAVDKIASFLREHPDLSVSRVVKGGSMSKGTSVRNNSDIDLVLNLNHDPSMHEFEKNRGDHLKQIKSYLRTWKDDNINIQVDKCSYYVLKCNATLKGYKDQIPVDLLVGRDIPKPELYQEMNQSNAGQFSSSLALLQRDFVRSQPPHVKDIIRLVKDWKITHLKGVENVPNSYALELITINEWEKAGKPQKFKTDRALKHMMGCLKNNRMINATWNVYYNPDDYKGQASDKPDVPFVLDPANPFENVAARFDWKEISRMADTSMKSPGLKDVKAGWC